MSVSQDRASAGVGGHLPAPAERVQQTYPTESTTSRNADGTITHAFVWNDAPWTLNDTHNGRVNRWTMNTYIAEWRHAFRLMSEHCDRLAWCTIQVDHLTGTDRAVDTVACAPAYKAALDGLRDWTDDNNRKRLGVLVDDGPAYVHDVTFHPAVYAGRDALILTLTGPAA